MKSKYAIASLIVGIISFINLMGFERPIVAIVFGALALKEIGKNSALTGKKIAIAGIILGIIQIIAIIVVLVFVMPRMQQLHKNAVASQMNSASLAVV